MDGIIPADARSTLEAKSISSCCQDHPRGCGEHNTGDEHDATLNGSSPRMRGARFCCCSWCISRRIIPADAGSTTCTATWPHAARDHPRGCGEHLVADEQPIQLPGSSPRMRGALTPGPEEKKPERIIPADAGSTISMSSKSKKSKDHPRGCGEHIQLRCCINSGVGSSPRMRGAPWSKQAVRWRIGIIPADAGSTWTERKLRWNIWDHPRGCGEHLGRVRKSG